MSALENLVFMHGSRERVEHFQQLGSSIPDEVFRRVFENYVSVVIEPTAASSRLEREVTNAVIPLSSTCP